MSVRVKICGITNREDALAAAAAGADALGFNFWKGSPRWVAPETVEALLPELPPGILTVGVFVNAPRAEIEAVLERVPLGAIQLHGDEPPQACRGWRVTVIKALRALPGVDLASEAERYPAEIILLDSGAAGSYGGSGKTFPWERAIGVAPGRLLLAGGLDPDNVAEAVRFVRPWGVDVAGGVERSPGRKDPQKIKEFVAHARCA